MPPFKQNHHITFRALVALELLVSLMSQLSPCRERISGDRHTDTHTQAKYSNPCCASALRVNPNLLPHLSEWGHKFVEIYSTAHCGETSLVTFFPLLTLSSPLLYKNTHTNLHTIALSWCKPLQLGYPGRLTRWRNQTGTFPWKTLPSWMLHKGDLALWKKLGISENKLQGRAVDDLPPVHLAGKCRGVVEELPWQYVTRFAKRDHIPHFPIFQTATIYDSKVVLGNNTSTSLQLMPSYTRHL